MMKRLILLPVFSLVLQGCTIDSKPRNEHEGVDNSRARIEVETNPIVQEQSLVDVDIEAIRQMQSDLASPLDHFNSIVNVYHPIVLNRESIEGVETPPSAKLVELLNIFNQSLLLVLQSESRPEGLASILENYREVLFSWCDSKLDNCHNIRYFYRSSISAAILQEMAKNIDDPVEYYQYLQMSFILKNHSLDTELRTLFVIRSEELMGLADQIDSELYSRHLQALNLIVSEGIENPEDPRIQQFYQRASIFSLDDSYNSDTARALLQNAFQHFLYDCADGSNCESLNGEFLSTLSEKLTGSSGPSPSNYLMDQSLRQIIERFQTNHGMELSRNLDLDLHLDSDEYLFILNGLIKEEFSSEYASQLYQYTRQDSTRMIAHINKYTKLLLAQMLLLTNEYMIQAYAETQDMDPRRTAIYVIEQSMDLSNQWSDLISRIEVIRNFASQNLRSHEEYEDTEKVLLTVSKNVKYMAVYPQMMMLAYQLEDQDIPDIDINIRGYRFTIPTKLIINAFFDRGFPPWFVFVNDRIPLKKHQLIYTFYYAIKTSTFKNHSSDQSNNNEFDFMRTVMGKYLQEDIRYLGIEIDNNESHLRKAQYSEMRKACSELNAVSDKKMFSEEWLAEVGTLPQAKYDLSFKDVTQSTFLGPMSLHTNDGLLSYPLKHLKGMGELLHKVRNEILPNLSFVRSLFEVLKATNGISDSTQLNCDNPSSEIHREICDLESFLSEKEDMVRRFWAYSVDWHTTFGKCIKGVHGVERARQRVLIEREKNYLSKIYYWMRIINQFGPEARFSDVLQTLSQGSNDDLLSSLIEFGNGQGERSLIEVLNSSFLIPDSELPIIHRASGTRPYSGLDRIIVSTEGGSRRVVFNYSNVDIHFRLKNYLIHPERGIAPEMVITPISDLRTLGNSYTEEKSTRVSYTPTLNEFLRQAMESLSGVGDAKANWFTRSAPGNYVKEYNKVLVELLLLKGKKALHCSTRVPQADHHPGTGASESTLVVPAVDEEVVEPEEVDLGYVSWRQCQTQEREINVTGDDIVEHVKDSARMLNIYPEDEEYLQLMGKDEMYNEISIRNLYIDRDDWTQPWSYLKPIYKLIFDNSTNAEWTKDSLHQPYTYYRNQKNLGFFIFEIEPLAKELVRCEYKKYVKIYEDALNNLSEAAQRATEADRDSEGIQLQYTLDRSTISRDRRGQFSYLGQEDIDAYRDRMREFHGRETRGFFQSEGNCSEGGL